MTSRPHAARRASHAPAGMMPPRRKRRRADEYRSSWADDVAVDRLHHRRRSLRTIAGVVAGAAPMSDRARRARAGVVDRAGQARPRSRGGRRNGRRGRPGRSPVGKGGGPRRRRDAAGEARTSGNGSGNDRLNARPPGALRAPWRRRPSTGASADDDPSSSPVPSIGSERPATPREHVAMASDHRLSGRAGPNSCGLRALERPDASSNLPVQTGDAARYAVAGVGRAGASRRTRGRRRASASRWCGPTTSRYGASALRPVHPTTARTALGPRRTGACACQIAIALERDVSGGGRTRPRGSVQPSIASASRGVEPLARPVRRHSAGTQPGSSARSRIFRLRRLGALGPPRRTSCRSLVGLSVAVDESPRLTQFSCRPVRFEKESR